MRMASSVESPVRTLIKMCIRDRVYVCKSIGDEYRQVRAPHCDRSHLENFGQLSNHLGADHILFVPDLTHVVHGRTMQQYLVFLEMCIRDKISIEWI